MVIELRRSDVLVLLLLPLVLANCENRMKQDYVGKRFKHFLFFKIDVQCSMGKSLSMFNSSQFPFHEHHGLRFMHNRNNVINTNWMPSIDNLAFSIWLGILSNSKLHSDHYIKMFFRQTFIEWIFIIGLHLTTYLPCSNRCWMFNLYDYYYYYWIEKLNSTMHVLLFRAWKKENNSHFCFNNIN